MKDATAAKVCLSAVKHDLQKTTCWRFSDWILDKHLVKVSVIIILLSTPQTLQVTIKHFRQREEIMQRKLRSANPSQAHTVVKF